VSEKANKKIGDYDIHYQWSHLRWQFKDEIQEKEYYEKEYFKGAMPAAFKIDSMGNEYMSVPRWNPGIPATLNKVIEVNGEALLEAFPSWEWNEVGNPDALQAILGFEIDENDVMWILDQGHVMGANSLNGSQKVVKWDLKTNKHLDTIIIPDEIASYEASFLNDLCVDNENGFLYIADSGIFTDPLQGGLIVIDTKTNNLRRILHQHDSTQDVQGYWFEIDGVRVWREEPMRTGADGIALSADRKTLYWCPLTGRDLYSIRTEVIRDFNTNEQEIDRNVINCGSKGTNTDGMTADNRGRIWFTMLESMGMGYYNTTTGKMIKFLTDERMVWVDTPYIDNKGYILFTTNQLHLLNKGELDYKRPDNLIVWKAYIGEDVKSYLYNK